MGRVLLAALLIAAACSYSYAAKPHVTCKRDYRKLGCFWEKSTSMKLLISDRDPGSPADQGYLLDWGKFGQSIHSLACRCSAKAKAEGYTYFSIRFWAECWAGKKQDELESLMKDPSKHADVCANGAFKTCDDNHEGECVGRRQAEYIYTFAAKTEESVDGGWSEYSEWSECSTKCGPGIQIRERTCTEPKPVGAGKDCVGEAEETRSCEVKKCPINGGFSRWGNWADCSKKCGGGVQERKRFCNNPKPQFGGKNCSGVASQSRKCNQQACPVNGGYSAWGACSASCDGGWRTRKCNNPAPAHGGKQCQGAAKERCNTHACPAECAYANWWSSFDKQGWSTCSSSNQYIRGLWRNGRSGKSDKIYRIEQAYCCKRSGSYGNEHDDCYNHNWWSTFDKKNRWGTCNNGYFMRGMYRSKGSDVHNIEQAKCCKPRSAPKQWGHCYNHNVGSSFDNKGLSACNSGYIMTGFYRGNCDKLYCIEWFKCCKLKTKQ